jgi:hypothetical protein
MSCPSHHHKVCTIPNQQDPLLPSRNLSHAYVDVHVLNPLGYIFIFFALFTEIAGCWLLIDHFPYMIMNGRCLPPIHIFYVIMIIFLFCMSMDLYYVFLHFFLIKLYSNNIGILLNASLAFSTSNYCTVIIPPSICKKQN